MLLIWRSRVAALGLNIRNHQFVERFDKCLTDHPLGCSHGGVDTHRSADRGCTVQGADR